jgi:hypothetical protein
MAEKDSTASTTYARQKGSEPSRREFDALATIADEVLREKLMALAEVVDAREAESPSKVRSDSGNKRGDGPSRLPHFANAHALPNAFLRAALFPALDTQRPRPFLQGEKLYAVGDLTVTFTGQQFDQGDLDVLAGIFEIGTPLTLGSEFRFSSYALLKLLGKQTGGREYATLHKALIRLNSGTIEIKRSRRLFFGSFIQGGFEDEDAREYTVRINDKLGALFGFDMWSQVDREQRRALGKNGAAKALHGYYSSHANPGAHRYDTLAAIAGLTSQQRAHVKRKVIKAHDALANPECGFLVGFKAGPATITVQKAEHTVSQERHIKKRAHKRRKLSLK